jgi:hypothetical protein
MRQLRYHVANSPAHEKLVQASPAEDGCGGGSTPYGQYSGSKNVVYIELWGWVCQYTTTDRVIGASTGLSFTGQWSLRRSFVINFGLNYPQDIRSGSGLQHFMAALLLYARSR